MYEIPYIQPRSVSDVETIENPLMLCAQRVRFPDSRWIAEYALGDKHHAECTRVIVVHIVLGAISRGSSHRSKRRAYEPPFGNLGIELQVVFFICD